VLRVQGLASSVLFDRNDPLNPVNRRISIIVMNREAEERFFRTSPEAPDAAASAIAAVVTDPAGADVAPAVATPGATPLPVDIVPQVRPSITDNLRKP
jgi:chemotaxis protein MotB